MSRQRRLAGMLAAVAVVAAGHGVGAQSLGTFRWQLQPYCNAVTVTVTQQGGAYTIDGFDDQCGAEQRAPLVGVATPNPDGSIGFGLHVVTVPGGRPVHVEARITLASLSGPWRDSAGNSGVFAFNGSAVGAPRPAPTIPGSAIAPGTITAAQLAPATIGAAQLAPGLVAGTVAGFGTCPVGQYLRGLLPAGTPVCEPIGTPPLSTGVDTANVVGVYSALAIGGDGLPIVAHHDQTAGDLRVTHCSNPACTAAISTNADTGGGASGWFPAIALGADGRAIIAHFDPVDLDLRVTHCTNVLCTAATSTAIDTVDNVGQQPSIAIGSDGLAIISHFDAGNGDLRVTHCSNVVCTAATTTAVDTAGVVGIASSLAIGSDGRAVIAHANLTTLALRVTRCTDVACTTATNTPIAGELATDTGVIIATSGRPVVLHAVGTAWMTFCADVTCSSWATSPVPDAIGGLSLALGSDGAPIYSSIDGAGGLTITKCADAACSTAAVTSVDSAGPVGFYSSIAIGVDGLPVVSHFDLINGDLRVTKCNSRNCR